MVADEKTQNFKETSQQYCTTVFQFLSYLYDKSDAEEAEHKFQEELAKQRRVRR